MKRKYLIGIVTLLLIIASAVIISAVVPSSVPVCAKNGKDAVKAFNNIPPNTLCNNGQPYLLYCEEKESRCTDPSGNEGNTWYCYYLCPLT